jgi:hypothetical protein
VRTTCQAVRRSDLLRGSPPGAGQEENASRFLWFPGRILIAAIVLLATRTRQHARTALSCPPVLDLTNGHWGSIVAVLGRRFCFAPSPPREAGRMRTTLMKSLRELPALTFAAGGRRAIWPWCWRPPPAVSQRPPGLAVLPVWPLLAGRRPGSPSRCCSDFHRIARPVLLEKTGPR